MNPLTKNIQDRFNSIPIGENVVVNKQIPPTKIRSTIKQYNLNNPHKWGCKILVRSGISILGYNFYGFQVTPYLQVLLLILVQIATLGKVY